MFSELHSDVSLGFFRKIVLLKYSASTINHVPDLFNKTSWKLLHFFLLYFKHNLIIILKFVIIVYIILTSYMFESRISILKFQKSRKFISKCLLVEM